MFDAVGLRGWRKSSPNSTRRSLPTSDYMQCWDASRRTLGPVDGDLLGMARLEQVGSAGGRSGNRSRARLRCRYPLL